MRFGDGQGAVVAVVAGRSWPTRSDLIASAIVAQGELRLAEVEVGQRAAVGAASASRSPGGSGPAGSSRRPAGPRRRGCGLRGPPARRPRRAACRTAGSPRRSCCASCVISRGPKVLLERTMSRRSTAGPLAPSLRAHCCLNQLRRTWPIAEPPLAQSAASAMIKSQRWESNPQPPHYECGALPIEATLAGFFADSRHSNT